MKTSLDCIPCFIRQTLEAVRFMTEDVSVQEQVLREVLSFAANLDMSQPPPAMAQRIHRRLREIAGVADPYREIKARFNRMALDLLPSLRDAAESSSDPFTVSMRMAIAGNIIDLGVLGDLSEEQVLVAIRQVLFEPFQGEPDLLRKAVNEAERILYLADNAGEIVLDRLFIERLPIERVTLAVRGGPIINDATLEDARFAGLTDLVETIDNGWDAPGTILKDCSPLFLDRFEKADLIISKGQGNYETLSDEPGNLFFLFKVKCPVIAAHTGFPMGTHVLDRNRTANVRSLP